MRKVILNLERDDLLLLLAALNSYQESLEQRLKRSKYLFEQYSVELRKQLFEDNQSLLLLRIYRTDLIRQMIFSVFPVDLDE